MSLVKFKKVVMTRSDKNGVNKYLVGIKIGDRKPYSISHQGKPLVFNTFDEAQSYIDDTDNF